MAVISSQGHLALSVKNKNAPTPWSSSPSLTMGFPYKYTRGQNPANENVTETFFIVALDWKRFKWPFNRLLANYVLGLTNFFLKDQMAFEALWDNTERRLLCRYYFKTILSSGMKSGGFGLWPRIFPDGKLSRVWWGISKYWLCGKVPMHTF